MNRLERNGLYARRDLALARLDRRLTPDDKRRPLDAADLVHRGGGDFPPEQRKRDFPKKVTKAESQEKRESESD